MEEERFQPEEGKGEPQPASEPLARQEVQTCRIERWRGYVTSRFIFVADEGAVFESEAFRWRRPAPPTETKSARAAYDELVARLEAEGWTFFADGTPWYRTTFARTVSVPLEATEPLEPRHVFLSTAAASPAAPLPGEQEIGNAEAVTGDDAGPMTDNTAAEPEAERDPLPAPEAVAPQPPRRRELRRPRLLPLAIGLATLAAGGTVVAVHSADARPRVGHPKVRLPAAHAAERPVQEPVREPRTATRTSQLVHVRFVAHGNGSWIEARRDSSSGKLLYSGILEAGKRLAFREPRLWVKIGAAGNLSITSDGKPVVLLGTYAKLFRPGTR